MQYATERRISSVWTVAYEEVEPGKVLIRGYSRECEYGYAHERELPRCRLIEDGDGNRTVRTLVVSPYKSSLGRASIEDQGSKEYCVLNPHFIFDYGEPPQPE